MQNIDNNMDNLFRKAADNYMPGTSESDWSAIWAKLSDTEAAIVPAAKKKKNTFWIWFLLLAAVATPLWIFDSTRIHNEENKTAKYRLQKEDQISNQQNEFYQKNNAQTKKNDDGKTRIAAEEMPGNNEESNKPTTSSVIAFHPFKTNERMKALQDEEKKPKTFLNQNSLHLPEAKENALLQNIRITENKAIVPVAKSSFQSTSGTDSNLTAISSSSSNQHIAARKTKFYLGLVLGPEISQVRRQGFTRTGIHAGLLAGYRLSKRVAIELGAEFKKKYYYSDGKYFRMKATPNAPAMTVLNLNGSSNVLEVPVRITYQAAQWKHSSLLASGGISSDLLMRESNYYRLSVNGVPQTMLSNYNKVKLHIGATADVSIGYEHKLGLNSYLRVQPYVQVPLQGMGVGNMQVMSAGINITVIQPFR